MKFEVIVRRMLEFGQKHHDTLGCNRCVRRSSTASVLPDLKSLSWCVFILFFFGPDRLLENVFLHGLSQYKQAPRAHTLNGQFNRNAFVRLFKHSTAALKHYVLMRFL